MSTCRIPCCPGNTSLFQCTSVIFPLQLTHELFIFRFDLIFLLLDPQNDTYDRRLARHMISLYFKSPEEEDADMLVRFIYWLCRMKQADEGEINCDWFCRIWLFWGTILHMPKRLATRNWQRKRSKDLSTLTLRWEKLGRAEVLSQHILGSWNHWSDCLKLMLKWDCPSG